VISAKQWMHRGLLACSHGVRSYYWWFETTGLFLPLWAKV